jgi:hypothetical protein
MGTIIDLDPFGGEEASIANSKEKTTNIRKERNLQNTEKNRYINIKIEIYLSCNSSKPP